MRWLLSVVVTHPRGVIMVWLTIACFGGIAITRLRVERLPDIDIPRAIVIAEHGSLSAEELERLITIPLENALVSIGGVREIEAVTKDGIASVEIGFDWNSNLSRIAVDIGAVIDAVYPTLPDGMRKPALFFERVFDRASAVLALFPEGDRSLIDIGELATKDIADEVRRIPGVGAVRVIGSIEPEIEMGVDAQRLASSGLAITEVASSVASAIFDQPVGRIIDQDRRRLITVISEARDSDRIKQIAIQTDTGTSGLTIGDIADVTWEGRERTSLFMVDGREAIGLFIYAGAGASLKVGIELRRRLPDIVSSWDRELTIETIGIEADEIEEAFANLILSLLLGIVASVVVLWLTMRSLRAALIVATSIPAAVAGSLLCISLADLSLNITSLSGIAIGIGMIVDNSVIVIEYLMRRSAHTRQEIVDHASEMAGTLLASTLTTVLVFAPILLIPGVAGALFSELALTVMLVLLFSLLAACSLAPALYTLTASSAIASLPNGAYLRTGTGRRYPSLLRFLFAHPAIGSLLLAAQLLLGLIAFAALPQRLMPVEELRRLEAEVRFPGDLSVLRLTEEIRRLQHELLQVEGVERVVAEAGYDSRSLRERARRRRSLRLARLQIDVAEGRHGHLLTTIGSLLEASPASVVALRPPKSSVEELLGVADTLDYLITDESRSDLERIAIDITESIGRSIQGSGVQLDTERDLPRYDFTLQSDAVQHYSLDARTIATHLRTAIRGAVTASLQKDGAEVDIRVRLKRDATDDLESLSRLQLPIDGETVEVGSLGRFDYTVGYADLYRTNRKPSITLYISVPEEDRRRAEHLLEKRPQGRLVAVEALRQTLQQIRLLFLVACLLIYLALGAQLESTTLPLPIMVMLLPAIAGSLLLLIATGRSINLNSMLGILILSGTSVNTAIILISAYRSAPGPPNADTILRESAARLRPIGATLFTTLIALVPITLFGGSSNPQADTAIAVIGGLTLGAAATILLIPLWYWWANNRRP